MVRTQIRLSAEVYERLTEVSHRLNRSMADCVREGIDLFLAKTAEGSDDLADIAGKFRPLPESPRDSRGARWAQAIRASKRTERP